MASMLVATRVATTGVARRDYLVHVGLARRRPSVARHNLSIGPKNLALAALPSALNKPCTSLIDGENPSYRTGAPPAPAVPSAFSSPSLEEPARIGTAFHVRRILVPPPQSTAVPNALRLAGTLWSHETWLDTYVTLRITPWSVTSRLDGLSPTDVDWALQWLACELSGSVSDPDPCGDGRGSSKRQKAQAEVNSNGRLDESRVAVRWLAFALHSLNIASHGILQSAGIGQNLRAERPRELQARPCPLLHHHRGTR